MRLIEEYLESNQRICYLSDIISYNSACCFFEMLHTYKSSISNSKDDDHCIL